MADRDAGLHVLLYGEMLGARWRRALGVRSEVWPALGRVRSVTHAPAGSGDVLVRAAGDDTVVIPLTEADIARCPPGGRRLAPPPDVCAVFACKRRFAAYVAEHGLEDIVARDLPLDGPIAFPCVLKTVRGRNGRGIVRVDTAADLRARQHARPWNDGAVVLQEWIEGDEERVTHLVCEAGRILWSRTLAYRLKPGRVIRSSTRVARCDPAEIEPGDLADMERLLMPLAFSGPCNVNYKRRADGRIAVLEINPRFGGSLMLAVRRDDLVAALAPILDRAR